jgi:hypothetical protein
MHHEIKIAKHLNTFLVAKVSIPLTATDNNSIELSTDIHI